MARNPNIDLLRLVAIFAVVVIHTVPFRRPDQPIGASFDLATVLNQSARFAVPVFFILAGYFWSDKAATDRIDWAATRAAVRRLMTIFAFWSLIYLLPTDPADFARYGVLTVPKVIYWNAKELATHPAMALLHGSKGHLWFLPSLASCVLISAALLAISQYRILIVLASTMFALALLAKAYVDSPAGIHAPLNLRDGPFFGLLFFVIGIQLRRAGVGRYWLHWGLALTAIGLFGSLAELHELHTRYGTRMYQDFVLCTLLYATGITMATLGISRALPAASFVSGWKVSLGIYAIHYLFVDLLSPLNQKLAGQLGWSLAYPMLVYLLSFALSVQLSKVESTRRLVS